MTDSFFRYGDRSCGSAGDERTYQSIVLTRQFRSYGEILVDKRAILSSNTEICFWRSFFGRALCAESLPVKKVAASATMAADIVTASVSRAKYPITAAASKNVAAKVKNASIITEVFFIPQLFTERIDYIT